MDPHLTNHPLSYKSAYFHPNPHPFLLTWTNQDVDTAQSEAGPTPTETDYYYTLEETAAPQPENEVIGQEETTIQVNRVNTWGETFTTFRIEMFNLDLAWFLTQNGPLIPDLDRISLSECSVMLHAIEKTSNGEGRRRLPHHTRRQTTINKHSTVIPTYL